MRKQKWIVCTLAVVVTLAYIIAAFQWEGEHLSTVVYTATAGLGLFAVCVQLKKEADIKEAEFLMDYNFAFLTTEKFVKMEHRLELALKGEKPLKLTEAERQDLVDYLVYLESLAPLILNRMTRLDVIDDLFGYRYFIAVNNPKVQELELKDDAEYYRGCFRVYRMWSQHRQARGIKVPAVKVPDSEDKYYTLDQLENFEHYAAPEGRVSRANQKSILRR